MVFTMVAVVTYVKQSAIAHLLLAITFFVSGIIINIVQCLLYVGVRPVNKYIFRKIYYYVAYSLYSQLVFLAEWWADSDVILYTDMDAFKKYYGKEHGYLIMNHTYEIDWIMGWIFCERVKLLGNCKTYAKKMIQYVPTMGWAWKFGESIFLERNWEKDKEIIGRQIQELVEYPDPMWLLLTAEGTRYTPEKHQASIAFAKARGLRALKHHLIPRTRGFTSSVPYLRNKIGAIYDIQIAFKKSDPEPTVTNLLKGKRIVAHMFVDRIPIENIPENEVECAEWLHNLFYRKDQLMDSFYKTNDFFAGSGITPTDTFRLPRRWFSLVNTCVWACIVLIPMSYYLLKLLTSGSTLYTLLGIGIIGIFFFLLSKIIGMTRISQASSYGKTVSENINIGDYDLSSSDSTNSFESNFSFDSTNSLDSTDSSECILTSKTS